MQCLYRRVVVTATHHEEYVPIPKGAVVRRVEAHVITVPSAYPDAATGIIDLCSLVQDESPNDSTWLFGQEPIIGRQPVAWQGKLPMSGPAKAWIYFQGLTAGNQIEIAVTIE